MYGGKLRRIKFKYTGRNVEAVLDRLPAAKIIQKTEVGYILTAEVFGNVVDTWIKSRRNMLEITGNKYKKYGGLKMITDYQSRKKEVLTSYDTVKKLVSELSENAQRIGMPNPLECVDKLLTDIRSKAEKVRADRFKIMITGEAKSGKSTFINAYLGMELLPMDVKQCTSSIVEVKYGKEFEIISTYADGRQEKITGNEASKEFLRKNAALDDEYRDIPVPTINNEIIVKSGLRAKKRGVQISISKQEVDDLITSPEVKAANIHNIPINEYNRKIWDYINKRKNQWKNIVTKIEVFFPFIEEMRGIEIIDSPGVCTRGGVSDITSDYIENADAIIFLKPVSGQALESTPFNQFMSNASVERNKNAMFLVLTRATNVTSAELRRLEDEAYHQFSSKLDKRNIFLVDSKAELYAKQFAGVDDVKAELQKLNKKGTLDDFVVRAYTDTSGLFGDGDKNDFICALKEKSRFAEIYTALESFGRKAHYILLGDLLDSICKLYNKLWNDTNIQMDMFRQKAEDPIKLAGKIVEVNQEIEVINDKMRNGVNEVVRRFRGDEGLIRKTAEKAKKDFSSEISSINANSNQAFNELERYSQKKIDEFKKLAETLQQQVVAEFDKELVILSDKSTIPFESLKPDFTDNTFAEIRDATRSQAKETHSFETGTTFKKTHTYSEYSQNKHYFLIKDNITARLEDIKNDLIDYLEEFVEELGNCYINELFKNAEAKKNELDSIYKAKANAEQIIGIVDKLNEFTKRFKDAELEANKIKGGIKKNVQ